MTLRIHLKIMVSCCRIVLCMRLIVDAVQLLNAARDLASFNRPPARDYLSVKSYFDEETPLCNIESYIYHKEDLISLKPGRENAWLDVVVEKFLQKLPFKPIRASTTLQIDYNSYK